MRRVDSFVRAFRRHLALNLVAAVFLSACGAATASSPPGLETVPSASPRTVASGSSKEFPEGYLPAYEAKSHVGESANVCGKVETATYSASSSGGPTFLNLDAPYPKQLFTILIWEEDRASYAGAPEALFADARVCISGVIEMYQGTAQVVARGNDIEVFK